MKNDNIKSDWKKYTITQKISFVLVVLIFALLILGSVGGLLYLFKSKKVSADEYVGGVTDGSSTSSAIVSFPVLFECDGAYLKYPNIFPISSTSVRLSFQFPFIFKTETDKSLSIEVYNSYTDSIFVSQSLPINVGSAISFLSYNPIYDDDFQFFLRCSSSNLINSTFVDLYSVEVTILFGDDVPVIFVLTDIDGSILEYELTPFRYEDFGSYSLNSMTEFSGRFLYIANSNVNFTERLNQAKEESFNNGYNQGYTEGKDYGYNVGYNQGVNDTDKFTFSSLLNAIFYAPLKAFISIFNFEILGVNVLNIISFLFTMLIAIGIIRWVV